MKAAYYWVMRKGQQYPQVSYWDVGIECFDVCDSDGGFDLEDCELLSEALIEPAMGSPFPPGVPPEVVSG